MNNPEPQDAVEAVAIVGMAGRFPGATTVEEFWRNLRDGVESVYTFSDEELRAAGVDPSLLRRPDYVKLRGRLGGIAEFDARFFGMNPREADITDPQQRLFLECAWEALEVAGYPPAHLDCQVGVFGGCSSSAYALQLRANSSLMEQLGAYQVALGNDTCHLATRVAYKLNLRGPAVTVQTACSTSLVAVVLACQSLLTYQCDVALAGGASIALPQEEGYFYQEGGILSPDGHCRAFDAEAAGTAAGSGVGVVTLKRLSEALADGDTVYAVIKGAAINNDGAGKVGYTAPSVEGQAEVITMAQALAGVSAESISYVEAHGTGTPLGDPIELAALRQVFGAGAGPATCAIGAVKTNIGHADAAAGVAGLLKAVLALRHRELPPNLHFSTPNPKLELDASPFYVPTETRSWPEGRTARRAGVSSFGIGGTNAHVVLEEAPEPAALQPSRLPQLLVLSAQTEQALEAATANLAGRLEREPTISFPDVAYTLAVGRSPFAHRRGLVSRDAADAAAALRDPSSTRVLSGVAPEQAPAVAFLFPGQGTQHAGMLRGLYDLEPAFREQVDSCCDLLAAPLGRDLRRVLYPLPGEFTRASDELEQTALAQPALFVMEYALARLWAAWGVQPQAMLGHSIGEYVAACLAGVLSLEDALALVATRGRLMQSLPAGAMAAVPLAEAALSPRLGDGLSLAAVNGPALCVISGPPAEVARLQSILAAEGVSTTRLHTSHAFHSSMVEPILPAFAAAVRRISLHPPTQPYLSNVTGTWITAAQAVDPDCWAAHLRQTVRFADGLAELTRNPDRVFLEVGPGTTLTTLARRCPARRPEQAVFASCRHQRQEQDDREVLLSALSRLWLAGQPVAWSSLFAGEQRRRISLPTYPFQRAHHWIEAPTGTAALATAGKRPDPADWFYIPSWRRTATPSAGSPAGRPGWLVFAHPEGLGAELSTQLAAGGQAVSMVSPGERFAQPAPDRYTVRPGAAQDYALLLDALVRQGRLPGRIAHLWNLLPVSDRELNQDQRDQTLDEGFYSLLFLAQALAERAPDAAVQVSIVGTGLRDVSGAEPLCPERAMLLGPCTVIPQEYPSLRCRSIDLVVPEGGRTGPLIEQLLVELQSDAGEPAVAYRGDRRWVEAYDAVRLDQGGTGRPGLREGGVYLITGGLGRLGLAVADYLAGAVRPRLVLVGRSALPEKEQWKAWLEEHEAQDPTAERIRRVQALEALGAEVLVICADVANQAQIAGAIRQACDRFGTLHGVIHAAGLAAWTDMRMIAAADRANAEAQFRPKVQGVLALDQALRGRDLDFCILFSSLAAILGGLGSVAYAAANLFMDAFAATQRRTHALPWVSVNWDRWDIGDAPRQLAAGGGGIADLAMSLDEGVAAFRRIVSGAPPAQLVVSTGDLQQRLRRWINRPAAGETAPERTVLPTAQHARPALETAYAAPANELELTITCIWQDLLGLEQVGRDDSFFTLGGDSVLGLQMAARAAKVGLHLTLRDLFECETVARLAAAARSATSVQAEQGRVRGAVALTPIQRWFFQRDLPDPHHFNLPLVLEASEAIDPATLERALEYLPRHHDALRLRYRLQDGQWQQAHADERPQLPFTRYDLRAFPPDEQEAAMDARTAELQQSLNLGAGPLVRAIFFERGARYPGRLVLIIHHLVVDVVSWRILLEDLNTAYAQIRRGEPIQLPRKTTSLLRWAEDLIAHAQSPIVREELPFWLEQSAHRTALLPVDVVHGANTEGSARTVQLALSEDETRTLLHDVPAAYHAQISDVLLTALVQAMAGWTAGYPLVVDMEGHGRETFSEELDPSRTVGWFTTLFPLRLGLEGAATPGAALKVIKEQVRRIPRRGIGYGLLRYLCEDRAVADQLRTASQAPISFLYLGQLDQSQPMPEPFRLSMHATPLSRSPAALRSHLLEFTGMVIAGRLVLRMIYSENIHHLSTIQRLCGGIVEALQALIAQHRSSEFDAVITSDFPLARASEQQLKKFLAKTAKNKEPLPR